MQNTKIGLILAELYQLVKSREESPVEGSYTNYLLEHGDDKIAERLIGETTKLILALKNDEKDKVVAEMADIMYHYTVLLAKHDLTYDEVYAELDARR